MGSHKSYNLPEVIHDWRMMFKSQIHRLLVLDRPHGHDLVSYSFSGEETEAELGRRYPEPSWEGCSVGPLTAPTARPLEPEEEAT